MRNAVTPTLVDTAALAAGLEIGLRARVRPKRAATITEKRRRGRAELRRVLGMVQANLSSRLRKVTCRVRVESARPRWAASPQGTIVASRSNLGLPFPVTVGKRAMPSARVTGFGDRADRLAGLARTHKGPQRAGPGTISRTVRPRAGVRGGASSQIHARA